MKSVLFVFGLVTLLGQTTSFAAILSPFKTRTQGELIAAVQLEDTVLVLEYDYAQGGAGAKNPYVLHTWTQASGKWTTQQDVHSDMYLDGGTRLFDYEQDGMEFQFELPSRFKRDNGEVPKASANGMPLKVIEYGAVGSGFKEILPVIKSLYPAEEQASIETEKNVPMFDSEKPYTLWQRLRGAGKNTGSILPHGTPTCTSLLSGK